MRNSNHLMPSTGDWVKRTGELPRLSGDQRISIAAAAQNAKDAGCQRMSKQDTAVRQSRLISTVMAAHGWAAGL
jgi:hypothetical protein